ncbi:mobilization protein [Campylobacter jejuni]|uniref:mobilization protein n=1 Tax=Campylobacter jejuni TaxID=197 RepID=UPI001EDE9BC7|nr:mobilization protein [Campylobacter jejuni]MCC3022675.1 mobilization protein [Campylobacter jejuni]
MAQISSINFKKSNPIQTQHNDRDLPPSYLIGGKVECNLNHKEALALKNQIIKDAIETYNRNKSAKAPSFKAKSYEWSAVVNIKPDTTMNDLENLSKHFQEKYGFQCYQIAIHRDEGHLNEKGEKVINHHAHMEFITLDKQTGKNNFRREKITPKALRQMQSEVAEILKMERGVDKRKSGVKRIEPRAYAVLKEKEKKEKRQEKLLNLLSKTQYQQIIENFRKEQAGKGFKKEFFKDLSELKKNFQEVNETSLSELLNDILEKHREYLKDDQEKDFLKEQINSLEKENQILKKTIAGINNREELIFIEEKEIKTGKVDFLIKSLKQGLTNQVLKEHNHYEIKNNYEALKEKNQELELKLIGSDLEIKKRDDFINSLGRMLNFQGLNYNTPLNELERYLNQKEQKNDKYTNKIKKMDLKAI